MPVLLDCNFVVDSTNSNGLGVSSLKGAGIQNVYMHTSATAAAGNPNPSSGYAIVQLQDNYNRYFGGFSSIIAPNSGSSILVASAGVVNHTAYVITIVGTTTLAGWQSLGLPVGITPAVGVSFVAKATTTATGTGAVQVEAAAGSGIASISIIGNPNLTLSSSAANVAGISSGAYLIVRFNGLSLSYTPAGTVAAPVLTMDSYTPAGVITNGTPDTFAGTPAVLTGTNSAPAFTGSAASASAVSLAAKAPTDGSIINLGFYLSNSSILVQGE